MERLSTDEEMSEYFNEYEEEDEGDVKYYYWLKGCPLMPPSNEEPMPLHFNEDEDGNDNKVDRPEGYDGQGDG